MEDTPKFAEFKYFSGTHGPVLPKAKGHAGKNGKSDGASDRGKSPGGGKDNPCWYHFKSAKGCVKGNECTFSHSKKTEHKLENMSKGKGKGKSKSRSSSPKRDDGACFAFQKGKCDRGSACKYRHKLIKKNSAPATSSDKAQAKSKAAAKAAAPATARRAVAMPAIVLKQSAPAGKVSFKKDVDQVEPDEAETVYHEHDDDAMSESSRWSGESEIPEKMVWFKEVLDVDENGEITYLEDERRQWERKGEWRGDEDNENEPYQYVRVDEKKFKSSDHRELSAYQVQQSLIRAKILREVTYTRDTTFQVSVRIQGQVRIIHGVSDPTDHAPMFRMMHIAHQMMQAPIIGVSPPVHIPCQAIHLPQTNRSGQSAHRTATSLVR